MSVELDNALRDALLRGDAVTFNRSRAANRGVHCVIRAEDGEARGDGEPEVGERPYLNLTGLDLSEFDLAGLTFEFIDFTKVVFGLASLASVTFDECTFSDCSFTTRQTANLAFKNCYVVDCSFNGVRFDGVKAEGTWFQEGTQFFGCDFTGFQANTAHFVDVNVTPKASLDALKKRYTDGIHGAKRPRKKPEPTA